MLKNVSFMISPIFAKIIAKFKFLVLSGAEN